MQQIVKNFLAGLVSGIFGTAFFATAMFIMSSKTSFILFKNKENIPDNSDIHFIMLILIVFVSILVANILLGTFYYLFNKNKYPHPEKTMFTIVIGSLAIEALIVPMFLIFGSLSMINFYFVMILQIIFPIIFSQLIIESYSKSKNILAFNFTLIISTLMSLLILLSLISLLGFFVLFISPILILPLISIGVSMPQLFSIDNSFQDKKIIKKQNKDIQPENNISLKHDYSLDEDKI